jgi:hypothetical protein
MAAQASWGNNGSPDVQDRVVAGLPYILPLIDGIRYGE